MGSSSGEASNKGIDGSVGGLVWVRRRNGSWWPGRIMGLDEVSESFLVSPRSGTPVKLLGREDASVDWYNLEKSKRVKAFRCGEYDDCIAKAKASAASSSKKAVKYARREDAIIHALEIENARLANDPVNFNGATDNLGCENGTLAGESPSMSQSGYRNDNVDDDVSDSRANSDSAQELSQSGLSFEEPNHISSSKVQSMQGRRRTPNDSEDDGTEGVKRMRGLEDLGVGMASKRKAQAGALLELVQQENASLSDLNNGNSLPNGNAINGSRGSSSTKRKRTPVANVHEFLKKKNRRRPLAKVLESTTMVSVPVVCDQVPSACGSPLHGVSELGKVSILESTESKGDRAVTVNNNKSDRNEVSCEDEAALNASDPACDTSLVTVIKENDLSSPSGFVENDSSDMLFDVPFIGEEKQSADPSLTIVPSSSEKLQVGGLKRQSSQSSQADGVSSINEAINETGSHGSEAMAANMGQRLEKGSSKWQLKGKRNSRKMSRNRKQDSRKYANMDDKPNASLAGIIEKDELSHGFNQTLDSNGITGPSDSHDCALETKPEQVVNAPEDESKYLTKHQSPSEPDISEPDGSLPPQRLLPYRQSRFTVNSRYRTSDISIRNATSDSSLYEVKVEVKANYKPPHVPLVSLMSKLNGKAIVGHPLTVEVLEDGFCDRMLGKVEANSGIARIGYVKRGSVKTRNPNSKHLVLKSQRKLPKRKKSGLLTKKIRKLSSLNGGKKSDERKTVVEKPKHPVIACIPLKLVFSRINEAVNGSARQTHRV